jgi:hypothetical protein
MAATSGMGMKLMFPKVPAAIPGLKKCGG